MNTLFQHINGIYKIAILHYIRLYNIILLHFLGGQCGFGYFGPVVLGIRIQPTIVIVRVVRVD